MGLGRFQITKISMDTIYKIMVDSCVTSIGYSDPARWKRVKIKNFHFGFSNPLLVYEIQDIPPARRDCMIAIQAISRFAEKGNLDLCTYIEIDCEMMLGYQSWKANLSPLAAFQNINFSKIQSPIERSNFFITQDFAKGEIVEQFIDFLLKADENRLLYVMNKIPSCTDFEKNNVSKLSIFKNMCSDKVFGRKKARDVYHFWAAECSNVDYFLTTDMKFIRTYNNAVAHNNLITNCKAISPEDLIRKLNIPIDGITIPESGKMFLMNGYEYYE